MQGNVLNHHADLHNEAQDREYLRMAGSSLEGCDEHEKGSGKLADHDPGLALAVIDAGEFLEEGR